jgi:hypothetical protein
MNRDRRELVLVTVAMLVAAAFWGAVIFVSIHFLRKWW